jgi:hypothetical protein
MTLDEIVKDLVRAAFKAGYECGVRHGGTPNAAATEAVAVGFQKTYVKRAREHAERTIAPLIGGL